MERKEVTSLITELEKSVISWAKAHRSELIIGGIFRIFLNCRLPNFLKETF